MPSLKMLANLAYALAHLCRHAVAWAISWVQVPIAVALIIAGAAIGAADAVFRTRDKSIAGRALERALRTVYTYGTRPAHRSLFITSGALARWSLTLRGFQFRDLQTPSGGRVVSIKRRDAVGTADVMILHVHGGAMTGGTPLQHAEPLSAIIDQLSKRGLTAEVLALGYPLAPENPFPAALLEVSSALHWASKRARNANAALVASGYSAGGNLVLSALLARQAAQHGKSPVPFLDGVVLVSPWLDLASPVSCFTGPYHPSAHVYPCRGQTGKQPAACDCVRAQRERLSRDFITPESLHSSAQDYVRTAHQISLLESKGVRIEGPVTTAHTLVSPSACPPDMTLRALRNAVLNLPVVVLAGEQEIFLPDIARWVDKVNAQETVLRLVVEPSAVHDYALLPTNLGTCLTPIVQYITECTRQHLQ